MPTNYKQTQPPTTQKHWFQSKIIWFSIIGALIEILSNTQITGFLPDNTLRYVQLALLVLTIVDRGLKKDIKI